MGSASSASLGSFSPDQPEAKSPIAVPPKPLVLAQLDLTNFRSYPQLHLPLAPTPIVFMGPNGAGKTNILEAISFLAPGRGLRRAKLRDIVSWQASKTPSPAWVVSAQLETQGERIQLGTGLDPASDPQGTEKRLIRVDGEPVTSQTALEKILSVIWLTPQMDRLFQEGGGHRRRFFDKLCITLNTTHSSLVYKYEYALRERSRLLKMGRADDHWLNALEGTMAASGVAIASNRQEICTHLTQSSLSSDGPFPKAIFQMEGLIDDWLLASSSLEVEERVRETLRQNRPSDGEGGGASVGPHISDLQVTHQEKNCFATFCSTGEQKALLISMILSHVRVHSLQRERMPLLLLDEVIAHLDKSRREAFFQEVCDLKVQAFLTGTDADTFTGLDGRAQFFNVEAGGVLP
ncbi:MAG: DNA replication/repair protein RecF, partial [Alphaproteobacteria bacterium]|nr:DNA replication/repair protein RecF [Alphaproteobacteria bacterium]